MRFDPCEFFKEFTTTNGIDPRYFDAVFTCGGACRSTGCQKPLEGGEFSFEGGEYIFGGMGMGI